jgi:branched-subunit amino acid aminotransferase/4-amino-4-deoxychorismate lyase
MEFAFATNAATGIRPVASVDGQSWPVDHPALKQLRDLYADIPAEQI